MQDKKANMKKRILVIEDEQNIRRLLELLLESKGFEVLIAQDGLEGLKKVRSEHPDVVILDLGLPKLPGEEVCKELKKDSVCENIPVIMLTGKNTDTDKIIGRVIGAAYYLAKPFNKDELLQKINICLDKTV